MFLSLMVLLLASWLSVTQCQDRGVYYDNTYRTWLESSRNCQQLGAWEEGQFDITDLQVPQRPPGYRMDQFFWIGGTVEQTPWFTLLGCFETDSATKQLDISNEKDPTHTCYLFCFSTGTLTSMGISQNTCYCYDNVNNHRKTVEQCVYGTFPNKPEEVYGAPNPGSVAVLANINQRPFAACNVSNNDFGNCAGVRNIGSLPVQHQFCSCLNRIGVMCAGGQMTTGELSWAETVKRCVPRTDINGNYYGLTRTPFLRAFWTGFYRASQEKWTPPPASMRKRSGGNPLSNHCIAVKVNNDGTIYQITYPQICTKRYPSLCERSTKVDGNWSPWSTWSDCGYSVSLCQKSRNRTCTNPEPKHGGTTCVGEGTEIANCSTCPVNGDWSLWSTWSACFYNSMGICQESRTRSCNNPEPKYGGKNCSDEATETYNCTTCPVNGQWSTWSSWSNCVYSMRLCQKSRNRSCNNPEPKYGGNNCTGEGTENTNCTSCAEPCVSDCTSKPDGDYQSCTKCEKFAQCQNGTLVEKDCPGGLFWDDSKKRCEFISTTCSIVPTS